MLVEADGGDRSVMLVSERDGYRLTASPDMVDAHNFRRLVNAATDTPRLDVRNRLLREALALWRGPALQDAASDRLRQRLCVDLDELHLYAVEESMTVGLKLGRHRELIPELGRLAGEHPLRESLIGTYMLALHWAGRTPDALEVYRRTRTELAEQLGLDPGRTLRHLHEAMLRGALEPPPSPPSGTQRTLDRHPAGRLPYP